MFEIAPSTRTAMLLALATLAAALTQPARAAEPIDIGSRLEPFVDTFIIEEMKGVTLTLNRPTPRELVIEFTEPWEGNTSCYFTVFRDGDIVRLYYRASNYDPVTKKIAVQRVCYAESHDGIHWEKPALGLFEYEGSKENNILWEGIGVHNFSPFKDANPNCKPEAKYKALASGENAKLVPFQSPDGIHWRLTQEEPVITKGAFDSQNLAFYDTVRGRYVDFHRVFANGVRAIYTCTSDDFIHWTEPVLLDFGDTPHEHLYTNAITAYYRAPHIFMGFPKRFVPSRDLHVHQYPGVSDGVFMTSRDGLHWKRWREALIRPGLQESRWVNRNNMTAWGILETESSIRGTPNEMSIYSSEGYYVGPCGLRRFTTRLDGFVSLNAPATGGEFVTKPIIFAKDDTRNGGELEPLADISTDAPLQGAASLSFTTPTILEIPGTQDLGTQATLAAHVRTVPAGGRRLFSAYNGGALDTTKGELWFDFDSDGDMGEDYGAIRFAYDTEIVIAPKGSVPDWSADTDTVHHIAATYDDGVVRLYFDGKEVASGGTNGKGPLEFALGDLRFGEDYPPTTLTNEPFLGFADDVLIARRALSPEEIARLAAKGASAIEPGPGTLYTFEDVSGVRVNDSWTADEAQNTRLPGPPPPGKTELLINYSTSAAGTIRCELCTAGGEPIPGYSLAECDEVFGDHIERAVAWQGATELSDLAGTPVRLRFTMSDADLYSIRFK